MEDCLPIKHVQIALACEGDHEDTTVLVRVLMRGEELVPCLRAFDEPCCKCMNDADGIEGWHLLFILNAYGSNLGDWPRFPSALLVGASSVLDGVTTMLRPMTLLLLSSGTMAGS